MDVTPVVPLGDYAPDRSVFGLDHLVVAKNVTPLTSGDYGPVLSISTASDALPNTALSLVSTRSAAGIAATYAATSSNIYRFNNNGTWTNVGGPYTIGQFDRFRFAAYGNDLVASAGIGVNVQLTNVAATSTFSDLSPNAPQAKYVATVRNFMMLAHTSDATDGLRSDKMRWSSQGNVADYPVIGSSTAAQRMSDINFFPDSGDITGLVPSVGNADVGVFCQSKVWRGQFVGPPLIFQFDPVVIDRGCEFPGTVLGLAGNAYYCGRDGWYVFNGASVSPIGAGKIDETFLADLDRSNAHRITISGDVKSKLLYCLYPGIGNTSGLPNKLLILNWITGHWALGEIVGEALGVLASPGYTMEDLDGFGGLDDLPYSLDNPFWFGGTKYLAIMDASHKLGQLSGLPLEADVIAGDYQSPDGKRLWITGIRPIVDTDSVRGAVIGRASGGATAGQGMLSPLAGDNWCPQRVSALYARPRISIAANTSWTRMSGYQLQIQQDGER